MYKYIIFFIGISLGPGLSPCLASSCVNVTSYLSKLITAIEQKSGVGAEAFTTGMRGMRTCFAFNCGKKQLLTKAVITELAEMCNEDKMRQFCLNHYNENELPQFTSCLSGWRYAKYAIINHSYYHESSPDRYPLICKSCLCGDPRGSHAWHP